MKPTLKREQAIHYVETSEIIAFIVKNTNMEWNSACDFLRSSGIFPYDGFALYERADILNKPDDFSENQVKWIGEFFNCHPWINRMMICFNE